VCGEEMVGQPRLELRACRLSEPHGEPENLLKLH